MLLSLIDYKRCLVAGLGALCLSAPATAGGEVGDYNFNETTGLINIPVARVAPAGSVQLSLGAHAIGGQGKPFGFDLDDQLFGNDGTVRLIAGLPGRVEVSVMGLHGGVFKNNRYVFGAKWLAVPDGPDHPAFAIGIQSLNSGPEPNNPHPAHFDTPSAFGVVSHSFPLNDSGLALDLHAGIGTGRLRNGFAGGELHITPEFSLMGETDGTVESAGFRFTPSTRFEIMTVAQFQREIEFGFLMSYRFGPTESQDEVAEELDRVPPDPNAGSVKVVTPEEVRELPEPPVEPESQAAPPAPVALSDEVAVPDPRYAPAVGQAIVVRPAPSAQSMERVVRSVPNSQARLKKRDRILRLPMRKRD